MPAPTPTQIKKLGYRPDLPDHRDHFYNVSAPATLPPIVDLRPKCPPVYNQGDLGSCTAQALAGIVQYNEIMEGHAETKIPSRLFIYYNERNLEGTVEIDAGATIRSGIRSLAYWGVPLEDAWDYDIKKFATRPGDKVYTGARQEVIKEYSRIVQKIADLRTCLYEKHPIAVGISLYESFMDKRVAKTGVVNMPGYRERNIGGHAVVIVGYDDTKSRFIMRNSWGNDWGQDGYFTIPYEYILNSDLTGDIWTIRLNAVH